MTGEPTGSSVDDVRSLDVLASCALLFALAVGQPLLDLLGRNPEFFVARNAPTFEIVTLAVTLTIAVPLALAAIAIALGRVHPTAGNIVHGLTLAVLSAGLALQVIRRTPLDTLPDWLQLAAVGVAGVALTFAYRRSPALRSVVRWGALAPILVLGLFLFASPASQLIVGSPAQAAMAPVEVGTPSPIVFIIFDAMPVSSLMDGDGDLQETLYPGFARLARDATWFRNATTVHYGTRNAVPAILTGNTGSLDDLPTLQGHPDNLFTLLDDTYTIAAVEPLTRLCPEDTCTGVRDRPLPPISRWRGLLSDLRIVAAHLFLPEDLAAGFPPIDDKWADFAATDSAAADTDGPVPADEEPEKVSIREAFEEAVANDRRLMITEFLERLEEPDRGPTLHFLHALIPHSPFSYLPDGRRIDLPQGRLTSRAQDDVWVDDAFLVDQDYQLHLLQVQYADTIVGDVIDRLEELGTYDETLIVVASDHGEPFRPGGNRHRHVLETADDVLPVPLFIKAPHQETGGIDDYRAQSTDILPTLADLLDAEMPWQPDGISLVAEDRPIRTTSAVTFTDGIGEIGTDGSEAIERARDKVASFGPDGPFGLAPPGHADLLGTLVNTLELDGPTSALATIRDPQRFDRVDTLADVLPVTLNGRLEGNASDGDILAVALNGEIVTVTKTYIDHQYGQVRFDALLPPDSLVDGANELTLLLVTGEGADRVYHTIAR